MALDVARLTIRFDHKSSPEERFIAEPMSGGVALIDYDGDGWPDIYLTNAQSVEMAQHGIRSRSALYHNNHDGTFADVTDKAGIGYPCWAMGVTVGDYNNAGRPDLLITCLNGVVLYLNNGDGRFTEVTKQSGLSGDTGWATGSAFSDYDNHGFADLFVAHYLDLHLDNLPAFGTTKACKYLGLAVQCGPRGMNGLPDKLYHNNGNGTFAEVSRQAGVDDAERRCGRTSIWSDFNNDGKLDLFVTNDGESNYLYQGDGAGKFEDTVLMAGAAANEDSLEQANMGLAFGDYMHTGRLSLAISHFDVECTALYINEGGMSFTDNSIASGIARGTRGYAGWGDAFVDFANSGWQDFFQVNGHVYPQVHEAHEAHAATRYLEPAVLLLNRHDGTFKNVSRRVGPDLQTPRVSRGLAIGDLFNDGRLEAVIENLVGEPTILRPEHGPTNHWVSFPLEGTVCNRLALNAHVKVTAGHLIQTNEVISGGSYLQSDLRLHFGLGTHDSIDQAKIMWPDGKRETLAHLAADKFYIVREGQGIVETRSPAHSTKLP